MNILFIPNQDMFNNVDTTNVVTKTNDEKVTIPLNTKQSVKSLLCSTPWLNLRSPYLPRLRIMGTSGFSPLILSISPMLQIFERSSVWKGVRSFYLLPSVNRT